MNTEIKIFDQPNAMTADLLTAENCDLLKKTQRQIFLTTGVFPSIYVLINELLNRESIEQATNRLIEIINCESNEDHFFATSLGRCKNVVA